MNTKRHMQLPCDLFPSAYARLQFQKLIFSWNNWWMLHNKIRDIYLLYKKVQKDHFDFIYSNPSFLNVQSKSGHLTWNDSAGEAGNSLDLCDVIEVEVFMAAGVELRPLTEERPKLRGHGHVVYYFCLHALVKAVVLQGAVAQQTDPGEDKRVFKKWVANLNQSLLSGGLWWLRKPVKQTLLQMTVVRQNALRAAQCCYKL